MELLKGETLAERLKRSPLPVDEALAVAQQIAAALEAAHERAVVHRDLKPGNIILLADGKVKVLDFGLAKAFEDNVGKEISNLPTLISSAATKADVIFGTAAYMSPEQVKGKTVDRRTDIWAFGVVLYEMLTGKQPFSGEVIPEILTGNPGRRTTGYIASESRAWCPQSTHVPLRQKRQTDLVFSWRLFDLFFSGSVGEAGHCAKTRREHTSGNTGKDLRPLPLDGGSSGDNNPVSYLQIPYDDFDAVFSPKGRWMAYASNQSGQNQVYDSRVRVSLEYLPRCGYRFF